MLKFIKYIHVFIVISYSLSMSAFSQDNNFSTKEPERRTIAFICDGNDDYFKQLFGTIISDIKDETGGDLEVLFDDVIYCDWDEATVNRGLSDIFGRKDVDIVVGSGALVCQAVVAIEVLPKPFILAGVYDSDLFNLPVKGDVSGRSNLAYLTSTNMADKEIKSFQSVVPFNSLAIFIDKCDIDAVSKIKKRFDLKDLSVEFFSYNEDVLSIISELKKCGSEAVYLSRTKMFSDKSYEVLIKALNDNKIPTFTMLGNADIQKDVLAGSLPRSIPELAEKVSDNVVKTIGGVDPGSLSVYFDVGTILIINAQTAQKIGIELSFEILLDSNIIYSIDERVEDKISIYKAVEEARKNNLLFRIKEVDIEKAKSENLSYWSAFLPQVDYFMEYNIRDTETAKQRGFPKNLYDHGLSLSQLIFSDPAIKDLINSKKEINIKNLEKDSATLDVTAQTSNAYLNYLKAKSFLKVEEENLKNLEANLVLAKERNIKKIGTKDEVLRWQSEISKSKSDVIEAGTVVVMARIIVNQLMNRPQGSIFIEEDVGLEMTRYYLGARYLDPFIGKFKKLESFMEFMVGEGIKMSPEIKTLNLTIKQQEQTKNTAIRKFFLPKAHLSGDLKKTLERKYMDGGSHEDDHPDWSVGLRLSYPLFEGGNKSFDFDKQKAELERLSFKKELAEQKVELEIRKSCYLMYHSYKNVFFSHSSMVNSSKNLEMIEEKYSEGTASVTDMIVAQQDNIGKERDAVVSVYDFLMNLVKFDRSVSCFYFLASTDERKAWLADADEYLRENK